MWDLSGGLPRLRDQHIVEVPIELGEGQPRIDAMNRLAYKSIAVGGFVPAEISPQALMRLRGELKNLRKQGRTQCFMLTDESVASPDLREWAPIFTNTTRGGSFLFTDSPATNAPGRFYRAVLTE